MRKLFYGLGLLVLLSGCARHEALNPGTDQLSFTTVASGHNSSFDSRRPQLFVLSSQSDLDDFWNQHTAGRTPRPPQPAVNFTNEVLLALIDKTEPSTGYSIKIETLEAGDAEITVKAVRAIPGPAMLAGDALTVPYHIVKTARTSQTFKLALRDRVYNE
jgi:hypothetical protein